EEREDRESQRVWGPTSAIAFVGDSKEIGDLPTERPVWSLEAKKASPNKASRFASKSQSKYAGRWCWGFFSWKE
ncbi:MAG: hypothetical protein P4L69_16280, partial [Desulfosporosinus sp.]|nr:hypothetical protein [Desulfosporosinus sp.]